MRKTVFLKDDFRFKRYPLGEADENSFLPEFDDSDWKIVSVPHDFGIEGEFSVDNDVSYEKYEHDGITEQVLRTGRTGGLPIVGDGVYRRWLDIDEIDSLSLEFDGVMSESEVYLNGVRVGGCHYGYLSFEVDITDHAKIGKNLLAVRSRVPSDSSRWYTGAGIYRNVRLVNKPKEHILYNGVFVKQISASHESCELEISVECVGCSGFNAKITSPYGEITELKSEESSVLLKIDNPTLWDVNSPRLYTAEIRVASGDCVSVRFGVRSIEFKKDGFFLNGRYLKMRGACMHHDMGMIGTAVNRSALIRQIEILIGMGVNAIRTSHNPPSPELLDLCDEYGILVMDEFFDEWIKPKVTNGYANHFREYAISDVQAIVKRDRNHPSVIMWSIGNEIGEQMDPDGWRVAKLLHDATKSLDHTRPTTAGCNMYPECFDNKIALTVDIAGLNYKPHRYKEVREKYPDIILLGSETESCVSTRGCYDLPADIVIGDPSNDELTVSDYGLCAPPWAYYAERELAIQEDCPDVLGEFVWTGFDYLGEPTPYYSAWPSRSSYFGVVDLAGLPKNRYYAYKVAWSDLPTLHVFPHWNFEGHEGEVVPVHVYSSYEEIELFINGISQGRRRRKTSGSEPWEQVERFRLVWSDIVYTPGEVLAIAYNGGKEVARKVVRTAGEPYKIELSAYYDKLCADGESFNFITAKILDKDGNPCPKANDRLTFAAEGGAYVYATDAGDERECETFLRPDKKALCGMLVACVKSNGEAGKATVSCSADGLISDTITFECI